LAKKISRRLRREFGYKGKDLPRTLRFLSSIPFHAIVDDNSGTGKQVRVEVTLRTLKSLLQRIEHLAAQARPNNESKEKDRGTIEKLLKELNETKEELKSAEETNKLLNAKITDANAEWPLGQVPRRSGPLRPKSVKAVIEGGYRGMQGGLPSLGKGSK
jgi:septal ring factor EnvC (AmiA/AmiB activator)